MKRAKKNYRQEPPFAVQVELSEGCNLYCDFCGLQGIREKKAKNFKFMTAATLESTIKQMVEANWNPRIEFAMHGEPTMHPELVQMVGMTRQLAPGYWLMMTSNAGGLVKNARIKLQGLFDAGLNVLALDDYEGANLVGKVRAQLEGAPLDGVQVYEYPSNKAGNPHARRPLTHKVLTYVADISKVTKGDGTHSLLNNHAGAGAPLNDSQAHSRCAKPFRELSVRWDGSVAVCCNDWRGTYKCGNVVTDGLDAVWNGAAMHAARQKLVLGQRDFGPCKGCDAVSYRVGLLPDKKGQVRMSPPDETTAAAISAALAGAPLTVPVLRPWEIKQEDAA